MKCKLLLNIILFVLLIVPTLLGQVFSEITIYGVVTDSLSGEALAGVFVEVINEANSIERASGFTDANGNYQLNLATDIKSQQDMGRLPSEFALFQNYPNPFNPGTRIQFQIPWQTQVRLTIYNMLGQKVRTLLDRELGQDIYTVDWDGTTDAGNGVAAGIYFYQLRTPDYVETRKMALLDGHGYNSYHSTAPLQHSSLSEDPVTLMLTIRATSPLIRTYEEQHVSVSSSPMQYNISADCLLYLFNMESVNVSELNDAGFVYIGGMPGAVKKLVDGPENVVIKNHRLDMNVSAEVNHDGSFPLLRMNAKQADRLSMTLHGEQLPISAPEELFVPQADSPKVIYSKPVNGDKDIILDVLIIIHFSEPVDTASVTRNTFFLLDSAGTEVPGVITMLNGDSIAHFDPIAPLEASSSYTIIVTTDVIDLQGLTMENNYIAQFFTEDPPFSIPDFQVNDQFGSSGVIQNSPDICINGRGKFVITWMDERHGNADIYAQRFAGNGSPIGQNFMVSDDFAMVSQRLPAISSSGNGKFIIVWEDDRSGVQDIFAQRYDRDGSRTDANFKVNDNITPVWQYTPSVATNRSDYFVITWRDGRHGGDGDIYAQCYDSSGAPIDSNFIVNDDNQGVVPFQFTPSVCMNDSGLIVIAWEDRRNTGALPGIYAHRCTKEGIPLGPNFRVNDNPGFITHKTPSVSSNNSGDFLVAWEDWRNGNPDIFAQRFAGNGSPVDTNFMVNDDVGVNSQKSPAVSIDEAGKFVIAWEDWRNGDPDIYMQRYFPDGSKIGSNFRVTINSMNEQLEPAISFWNGRIYNTWTDNDNASATPDIWANVLYWFR